MMMTVTISEDENDGDDKKLFPVSRTFLQYTAILRKVVGKNVHVTIPRGNM